MAAWDPTQYLRFDGERLRPAIDLLARIPLAGPGRVVDLGCGAGNVTALLRARWPAAGIVGIDSSPAMLDRARAACPDARFVAADAATWRPELAPDVIFSNAALQWVGDHETLLPRLLSLLAPAGFLAVQMPGMHASPQRRTMYEVAARPPFAAHLAGVVSARDILEVPRYWDLLRPHAAALDIWETTYLHVLAGEDAVLQWSLGTALRPFVDALPESLRPAYRRAYAEAVAVHYPRRPDGTTLLPFRRVFLLARR